MISMIITLWHTSGGSFELTGWGLVLFAFLLGAVAS